MTDREQRLLNSLTPLQRVMLDLDVAVTGVPIERAVTQYHHYPKTIEDWIEQPGGNPMWYLSDAGYSRLVWLPFDKRLFLTDNSTSKAKQRWDAAWPYREAALHFLASELKRLKMEESATARKVPRYPTDLRFPNDPYAQEVHELGGRLIRPRLPSPAKFAAQLAAYAPGCGSPTPVPGTGGEAPCGALVDGVRHFCPYCQPAQESRAAQALIHRLLYEGSPMLKRTARLQYRPYINSQGNYNWFWVLLPEDGSGMLANGCKPTRARASTEARAAARKLYLRITKVEVISHSSQGTAS